MADYDAIIVGAGYNGLTAAAYLAKTGLSILVLEQRETIGGSTTTIEVYLGFTYHPFHTGKVDGLNPQVVQDLHLRDYGFEPIELNPRYTTVFPDGEYLSVFTHPDDTVREIERHSVRDAAAYRRFVATWSVLVRMIPPELAPPPSFAEFVQTMSAMPDTLDLLRLMLFGTVRKTLEETFESDLVRAAFVASAQVGAFHPSSSAPLGSFPLLLCSTRPWQVAKGGLGTVAQATARAAERNGAAIRTQTLVEKILVRRGQAVGVALSTGEEISARVVVSNATARTTFLDLVGDGHLDDRFVEGITRIRYEPGGLCMNLALNVLPDFAFPQERLRGWVSICPSCDYAEQAFYECTMRQLPTRPLMTGCVASYFDDSLAPPQRHVMHLYAFPFPYDLRNGTWETRKDEAMDRVIEVLSTYAPNITQSILHRYAITPLDSERLLRLPRGDQGHGVTTWDQAFFFRPPVGRTDFRTPIGKLYLCGPDIYPGSNTTSGAMGYNAAHAVLEDWTS